MKIANSDTNQGSDNLMNQEGDISVIKEEDESRIYP